MQKQTKVMKREYDVVSLISITMIMVLFLCSKSINLICSRRKGRGRGVFGDVAAKLPPLNSFCPHELNIGAKLYKRLLQTLGHIETMYET